MDPKTHSLQNVQEWMQTMIMHPDGLQAAESLGIAENTVMTDFQEFTIDNMILPSLRMTSQQRMEVYANAYYARLLECLRDEFPALAALIGEETFNAFAFAFLQSFPSTSYTLADLGKNFPQFLTDNRTDAIEEGDPREHDQAWIDLMIDLALLERTYSEVFSGQGIEKMESLDAAALSAVSHELVGSICLTPAPCLRLLQLSSRAHEPAIAVRKFGTPITELPMNVATFLVVTRINYVVRTIVVEPDEFHLLKKLVNNVCLDDAIASVAEQSSLSEQQLASKLAGWFEKWAMDRLFVGFHFQ